MPTATTTPRVAQQSRHSPPTTPGTTVAQAMDKKPLMHKAQTHHVEHNDAPAARRATSMTCSGELVPASIIYVHPPTPESKTPVVAQIVPPAGSSPLARLVESRRRRVGGSPRSSSSASPVASPKLEDGPLPAGGQDVRPPRRKKSPSTSPTDSPRPSRTSSPRQSTPPALPLTEAVLKSALRAIPMFGSASSNLISPSSSGTNTPTATTPVAEMVPRPAAVVAAVTAAAAASSKASSAAPSISPPQISSSADVSRSASPSLAQQAAARRPLPRPSISPATTSFNSRRAAQGRPTLHSTATTLALKLNLENLDRPRFNASTQAFVTEPSDAPPAMRTTPLVRKKSGELVPSILRREHGPSYDGNPLSSTSTCSTGSASPYPLSSKSLPATPSCPKFVHFDTRLERVRLFLAEQKPAAVSRGGSPTDPAAPPGGGEEFPFPSTSDEEEALRRSLEIRLPNFPIQQPFDASVYLDSLALVEGGASLKGVVHVRNLSFGKRVCVRFTSDWWSTTSEVTAVYQDSIKGATFDRFIFHIKLQDLLARIEEKTLFLAIRYNADGHPEIWDSNGGQNYQVQFHKTKGMKASELRDTRRSVGRKAAEWSDKVHSGPLADRMADLKAQLSRLAADDPDGEISSPSYRSLSDGSSTAGSPGGSLASISTHKALYSPGLDPTASPLAARYDFGASLKGVASGNNKAGSPGFYRPNMKTTSVGTGWNGSPLGEERLELLAETNLRPPAPPSPLPSSSVAFSPTGEVSTDGIGLRFDPSSFGTPGLKWPPPPGGARFDPGPPSSFPSSIYGTLPTSPSSYDSSAATTGPVSFSAFAVPAPAAEQTITTTAMTPITESTALSTPTARKHTRSHSRSSDSSGAVDYFSAPSVRRTPPASPYITLGEPTTTAAPGRPRASAAALASRTFPAPTADELPSALVRHASYASSSSASSSPTSTSGTDSPLSMASTPNTTASNGGTPVGIPLLSPPIYALGGDGYDPSLSMPRSGSNWIGSSSYSDFVNQFCFFTGSGSDPTVASTTASSALGLSPSSSPPYRSPGGGSAAASVDSFFTPREGSSTSGFTTPTASVSPPSGGYPSHATAKHHSMSDYFSGGYTVSPVHSTTELEAAESSARRQQTPPALESSAAAKKYYAVKAGRKPGVYETWPEAQAQVNGFAGALHKSFPTAEGAAVWAGLTGSSLPTVGRVAAPAPTPLGRLVSRHARGALPLQAPSCAGTSPSTAPKVAGAKREAPTDDDASTLTSRLADGRGGGAKRVKSNSWAQLASVVEGPDGLYRTGSGRIVVYTDGSSTNNGRWNAAAGAGVWWGDKSTRNSAERVPGLPQTNNRGELLAILRALQDAPDTTTPLEIRTDSSYSIDCLTKWLPGWRKKGWKSSTSGGDVLNVDLIKGIVRLIDVRRGSTSSLDAKFPPSKPFDSDTDDEDGGQTRRSWVGSNREGAVRFVKVKGHVGLHGNERADALARKGGLRPIRKDAKIEDPRPAPVFEQAVRK